VSARQPPTSFNLEDQRRMRLAKNYFAWQSRLVLREVGRRVIEVGCGLGNFTGMLLDREAVVALDVEEACVEILRRRYAGRPNLHALVCDAADPAFHGLRRYAPDSCVCLNVLEHMENDERALAAMASVLDPAGTVVLLAPAFPSLYGPIDRNLGHFRRYRRADIRRLARATGLGVVKMHYMNFAGFWGWWANAHLFRRQEQSERQIAFFDRWVAPVQSAIESVVAPPIGQSLFAVLRKR
jgi:SAM-dependent methyltransferase